MADELDGLTAIDRLRLYATDPDTFSFDIDDAIAAVEKYEEVERRADLVEQMAAALRDQLRDDDELDECELCGGSGELTAMTVNDDRELISCPSCVSRERSRNARAALQAYEAAQ